MKTHRTLMLIALIVSVSIGSGCAAPARPAAVATTVVPTPRPANPPPYPPPPTPTIPGTPLPMATATIRPSPTPTWWPSPFPTPVRTLDPTPTPLPFITPAPNARGKIWFFAEVPIAGSGSQIALHYHPMSANGLPELAAPTRVDIADLPVSKFRLYPSPKGKYLAIRHDWFGATIVDLVNPRVLPLEQTLKKICASDNLSLAAGIPMAATLSCILPTGVEFG